VIHPTIIVEKPGILNKWRIFGAPFFDCPHKHLVWIRHCIFAATVAAQVFCFGWMVNGSKCLLLFPWCGVSRVISDHVTDCYFCMTNIRAFSRKNKSKISYPVCKSAIKPIPHDPDLPEPQPPTEKKIPCLLMNVRVPVLKVRRILLNQIPSFNMSLQCCTTPRQSGMPEWPGAWSVSIQRESRSFGFQATTVGSTGTRNNHFVLS